MRAKAAFVAYDRVATIIDGRVPIEGLDLEVEALPPSQIFIRMLGKEEFDICEMSLSSYLIEKSKGRDWTGIPVFPFRHCFHTGIIVPDRITQPEKLNGGRFGLVEFQVSAALWARGTLADDFGIDLTSISWYVERSGERSHGGATGFTPPEGIRIEPVPEDTSIGDMLLVGELDGLLASPFPGQPGKLNRTDERTLIATPGFSRLFRDPLAEARRYYTARGYLHINHMIVVRSALVREDPELPRKIFDAFTRAKEIAYAERDRLRYSSLLMAHLHFEEQDRIFGTDPFPYGMAANRGAIEQAIAYSHREGLTPRRMAVEELFAEDLLDT